ncbi:MULTISPECIES: hypothetical protein [unclassified Saccharothrix]|uniref:hypothetical protein n=1 Tax=unclassified Saccharothrix TaxID=2593673 RepID=UPI00307D0727
MPEWMRSQFMAPVYALLISFGVALALGANTKPSNDLTISLVTAGPDGQRNPATGMAGRAVNVADAAFNTTFEVDGGGSIKVPPAAGRLVVCVSLPDGWRVAKSQPGALSSRCVLTDQSTGDLAILVERG